MTKKGIVKDSWRYGDTAYRRPSTDAQPPPDIAKPKTAEYVPNKGDNEDDEQHYSRTIQYPNYGGITVSGIKEPEMAAAAILQFCVTNLKEIDNTLTDYGILVAQLKPGRLNLPFFISRSDGWTLTIPDAETRLQGLLALIQCFLTLDEIPAMKKNLRDLGIQPFRI